MANYNLVINSRFKPFSLEELWMPAMEATKAHQALEDAYSALGIQAGTVESMLNKELDRDAYNQYQGYMQGLEESANILSTQGLNPSLRGSLMNFRNRYSQEIIPIQKAAERREKLAEEQRKLGNSAIFDFNASMTGLDKFMNNPTLNYRYIDRGQLLKEAQDQFSQFQKELREFKYDPSKKLDKFHNTLVESYGFTPEEAAIYINQVSSGNMDESTAIGKVANNLYKSTGVAGWGNEEASAKVWNTIAEGITAGIGEESAQAVTDEQAVLNAKYANELRLLKEKARIEDERAAKKAEQDAKKAANGTGVIVPLRGRQELSKNVQKIEQYSKYFQTNADGTMTLTPEGWKAMYTYGKYSQSNYSPGAMPGDYTIDGKRYYKATDFGKFVEELNGGKPLIDTRWDTYFGDPSEGWEINNELLGKGETGSNYIGNLFSQYKASNNEDSYDTYRTSEIDIPLDNTQGEALTESIMRNTPNNVKIEEVDFNGNTRSFEGTGNKYSKSDLEGYKVTAIRPSKHGTTAFLHKDGKDDIRIKIPKGVNIGNLDAIQQGTEELNAWVQAAYSEYRPKMEVGDDGYSYIVMDENGDAVFTNQKSTKEDRQSYLEQANIVKANTIHNGVPIVRQATATTEKH